MFDKYLNKDAMLNYLSIMYASEGYDNVAKNLILVTYDGNIWYPILYDLDTTWGTRHRGNLGSNKDGKCEDYYWLPEGDSGYKSYAGDANDSVLLKKVIRCFPDELANRWFELRKNELSYDNIKNEFESFCNEIPQQMYAKDQEKWSTIAQYGKWDKTQIYGSDDSFLEIRLPYVDNVMYEKYTIKAKINVEYSTTDKTNKNVVATAIANRNDISFINGINTYTFSNNGVYKFEAVDYKGNKITRIIDNKFSKKISDLATNNGVSPYMVYLSAFFILLYKYTGQNDINIGIPFANRELNETKRMIGMFVNNIVARGKIESEISFKEFLDEIKEQELNDLSNGSYPYDMLVKKLGITGDASRNPLFDVMFIYQNNENFKI